MFNIYLMRSCLRRSLRIMRTWWAGPQSSKIWQGTPTPRDQESSLQTTVAVLGDDVYMLDQRIISQEPIANTDVLEELKQLLTTCDLDTMEEYFFAD